MNLPLALAFAWLVSSACSKFWRETVFGVALIVGYRLTNVLGFVRLHQGAIQLLCRKETGLRPACGELKKNLYISLAYSVLIVILIKLGVLKPIESYSQRS